MSSGVATESANVITVWVFGSAQDGVVREGSDIDIDVAILFKTKTCLDELASLRAKLQKTFKFDDIDLINLNTSSSILAFQAISGKLLYCADEEFAAKFVSETARMYEDEMWMVEKYLKL